MIDDEAKMVIRSKEASRGDSCLFAAWRVPKRSATWRRIWEGQGGLTLCRLQVRLLLLACPPPTNGGFPELILVHDLESSCDVALAESSQRLRRCDFGRCLYVAVGLSSIRLSHGDSALLRCRKLGRKVYGNWGLSRLAILIWYTSRCLCLLMQKPPGFSGFSSRKSLLFSLDRRSRWLPFWGTRWVSQSTDGSCGSISLAHPVYFVSRSHSNSTSQSVATERKLGAEWSLLILMKRLPKTFQRQTHCYVASQRDCRSMANDTDMREASAVR